MKDDHFRPLYTLLLRWESEASKTVPNELSERSHTALKAYLLDCVNRLKRISTVSDITVCDIHENLWTNGLHADIEFKLCGLDAILTVYENEEGTISVKSFLGQDCIEKLEAWQTGDSENTVEERFSLYK